MTASTAKLTDCNLEAKLYYIFNRFSPIDFSRKDQRMSEYQTLRNQSHTEKTAKTRFP
jgi:hypothetical protein